MDAFFFIYYEECIDTQHSQTGKWSKRSKDRQHLSVRISKLNEEEKNIVCMHANERHFSKEQLP